MSSGRSLTGITDAMNREQLQHLEELDRRVQELRGYL
jgi:hypothetical protein